MWGGESKVPMYHTHTHTHARARVLLVSLFVWDRTFKVIATEKVDALLIRYVTKMPNDSPKHFPFFIDA